MLKVLSTAVMGHVRYLQRSTPSQSWSESLPKVCPVLLYANTSPAPVPMPAM
ncbi:hypothetical protein DPMN_127955 [Dreissena polymorpha]|uniref:Uncharacterized protein n=1 Tax=Dreissena polymorpha TaxID=45954 RepID=A0A9D4GYJ0_DREPO|nr:hypothetical protein DPMN_127955 [Dreissena polymorpha]